MMPCCQITGALLTAKGEKAYKVYRPRARRPWLGSRMERMRAPDGELSLDCALPDNAVLFIELAR